MSRRRRPIYYVEWEDSESWSGWSRPERFPESSNCTTIGFLVKEEKRFLVFASSHDGAEAVEGVMRIPKVAIRKKRRLRDPGA
jgi:hypothetical protein